MTTARSRGFTLIELAMGLAIAALVTGMAVVGINSITDANLRSTAVELSGAIKTSYDRAIMEKRVQRLALDIDRGLWWFEYSDAPFALSKERATGEKGESASALEDEKPSRRSVFSDDDEDGRAEVRKIMEGHTRSFVPDDALSAKPRPLPNAIRFSRVWTSHQEDAFTSGVAYVHFFKTGQGEHTLIELSDEDGDLITLEMQPLTGRVRSHHKRVEVPRVRDADSREQGDE